VTKIGELVRDGRTFSFEFPPPRNDEQLRQMEKTLLALEPLKPSFCSVTYGAGGSTREGTYEAVLHIHRDRGLVVMPHLTCVGQTRADITGLLERYRDDGIENVLALAGDPPLDGSAVAGDFTYSSELIELAREVGDFSVAVAAFPEVHPRSSDRAEDRRRLADKLQLADFGMTQFFWEAHHYFEMAEELAALGVDTPVIAGVMPIRNVEAQLGRMSALNGTNVPDWLRARFDGVAENPREVRKIGVEVATKIAQDLLDGGVPGLHFYTLNFSRSILEIYANLGLQPGTA
jgi:methylenetetrahydrofolate reductase (NADPH)